MPGSLTNEKSTLVQVMVWCRQATSHYLSQCWPRSMSPNGVTRPQWFNTLRSRQNGWHLPDNIFKYIFLTENVSIAIKISLKFVHEGPINNITTLVQIMAWCCPGDKPLSEPMLVYLLTHICITRPQWVSLLPPWRYGNNFTNVFFNLMLQNDILNIPMKLVLGECYRTPLTGFWFR